MSLQVFVYFAQFKGPRDQLLCLLTSTGEASKASWVRPYRLKGRCEQGRGQSPQKQAGALL